jgi:hypothetical protein
LGVEPKGEGISGETGYKVSGQSTQTPAATPAAPAKVEEPKTKAAETTTQTSTSGATSSLRNQNAVLPVAKAVNFNFNPESVRPW